MRKITLFFILLFVGGLFTSNAQSNSIRVTQVVKPNSKFLYKAQDSTQYIISIRNEGPSELIAGDRFNINYSLDDGDSSQQYYDTLIQVGSPTLNPGQSREYVVNDKIFFNGNNIYSACASVKGGTDLYPMNPNKFPGECEIFTVNLSEASIKIEEVFYRNNNIKFNVANAPNSIVEIYNITGKLLLSKKLSSGKNQLIAIGSPTKGFYFLKVIDKNGQSSTAKFVVN